MEAEAPPKVQEAELGEPDGLPVWMSHPKDSEASDPKKLETQMRIFGPEIQLATT